MAALDGTIDISDFWEQWPEEAAHEFYAQCYHDVDAYFDHIYLSRDFIGSIAPGNIPINSSSRNRWLVELDLCLLRSGAPLDRLIHCRRRVGAKESFSFGSSLLSEVRACLLTDGTDGSSGR